MSEVGGAINEVRTELAAAAAEFMPDTCDVIDISMVSDGHSGHKPSETVVSTNIPCDIDEVPPGAGQIVAGSQTFTATHRVKFPFTSETRAIKSSQILKINARGNEPEYRLELPVPSKGSMAPFLIVLARLTVGSRQPSNV